MVIITVSIMVIIMIIMVIVTVIKEIMVIITVIMAGLRVMGCIIGNERYHASLKSESFSL